MENRPSIAQAASAGRPAHTREIAFVDGGAADYPQLADGLRAQRAEGRDLDVVVLDPQRDAVAQISDPLAQHRGLVAIRILSHGSVGAQHLGDTRLGAAALERDAAAAPGNWMADVVYESVSVRNGDADPDTCQSMSMLHDRAAFFALYDSALPVPPPIRLAGEDA